MHVVKIVKMDDEELPKKSRKNWKNLRVNENQ
jgi:hypothetical protein